MKRTVLVIDDDKMILDMIQGILEDKFEVSAVNDGHHRRRSVSLNGFIRMSSCWI